jgi:hemerythrin-like metal-binding protein
MASAHAYASVNHDDHSFMDAIGTELGALMMRQPLDRNRIVNSLTILRAAMKAHFNQEESIMKAENYPYLFQHKGSHDYIVNYISIFISSFAPGREDAPADIWPLLKKTLETHIAKYDDPLASYLDPRH